MRKKRKSHGLKQDSLMGEGKMKSRNKKGRNPAEVKNRKGGTMRTDALNKEGKMKRHAPSTRHALIGHQGGVRPKPFNQADGSIPVMRKTGERKKKSLVQRMEDSDMPV